VAAGFVAFNIVAAAADVSPAMAKFRKLVNKNKLIANPIFIISLSFKMLKTALWKSKGEKDCKFTTRVLVLS